MKVKVDNKIFNLDSFEYIDKFRYSPDIWSATKYYIRGINGKKATPICSSTDYGKIEALFEALQKAWSKNEQFFDADKFIINWENRNPLSKRILC